MLQLRPTFSESWYRVANLKVRLRPSAQISRQYYRGERWYVVRDPAGNQYHRLSDPAYRFCALLNGTRTINEAWELVGGMMDDESPTQPEVIQILSQLYAANLIEADVTPDSQTLLKRHRSLMRRKFQQRLMNTLFPRIPIWDPDKFLQRWMPLVRVILSWPAAVVWFVVVGLALFRIGPMSADLVQSAKDSIAPSNWFYLWAVFVFTKFIHEMGHASSTRRFGGECHEMGLMFLVFIPTPYVDASAAWSFASRWQRMFVGAAGMVVEIFFAALCAFVWASTVNNGEPFIKLINQLSYNAMLIASVSTVLFNANPLLRYDGYYMLSDFLEIPNLQKRSTDYAMGLFKRHLFAVKAREPLPNLSTRLWLFFYAITSSVYRVFVGLMIIIVVAFSVPLLGILMSIGGIITWIGMPIFKSLKYLILEPELHRKRLRAWAWSGGMLATAVLLLGFVKFPFRVTAEGVVEPVSRQVVHSGTNGFVDKIHVVDGQIVKQGDLLITLRDDQLEAEVRQIRAQLEAATIKYRSSKADNTPSQAATDYQEVIAYVKQLADREDRLKKLVIRSDISGQVVGPQLKDLTGRYLTRGQQLLLVTDPENLVVRALVTQAEAELIPRDGNVKAQVRVTGAMANRLVADHVEPINAGTNKTPSPALTFMGGGELQADPSDPQGTKTSTQQLELRVFLPSNASVVPSVLPAAAATNSTAIVPGQRAYVCLDLGTRTVYQQIRRRFDQLWQSNSNSKWF